MSEEPVDLLAVDDQPAPVEMTWNHVRDQMDDWPDPLRQHAARLLREKGLVPPDTETTETGMQPHNEEPVVEAVTPKPEAKKVPLEEQQQAYAFGMQRIYDLSSDERFIRRCQQERIDTTDVTNPAYWRMFSDFGRERAQFLQARGINELNTRAMELMAAVPAYIFAQGELDFTKGLKNDQIETDLGIIADFHNMITEMAEKYPGLSAEELELGLLNVVNKSITEDQELRQYGAQEVHNRIRGVQHEVAFADILRHTGLPYRKATRLEDWRGFDYVVNEGKARAKKLDVKASLKEVDPDRGDTPIANKGEGKFYMFSLIDEPELHDGFHVSDEVAKYKAEVLREYLNMSTSEIEALMAA